MPTSPLRLRTDDERPRMLVAEQLTAPEAREMQRGADSQFTRGWGAGTAGISAGAFANDAISGEKSGAAGWQADRDNALRQAQLAAEIGPRVSSLRDIHGVDDATDWAAGGFGQGLASMAPTVAAALLTRGRGNFGKATAFGGAMIPAYQMEKGEAVLGQYADPELAAASVDDRMRAAEYKGMGNAALESIVPAGLAGSILRKPTTSFLGAVGRNSLTEGATEAAQSYGGHLAEKALDPSRQFDPMTAVDAAALGALTGGGVSAVGLAPTHLAGAAADKVGSLLPNTPPEAAAPPVAEPVPEPQGPPRAPGQFEEILNSAKERFGPQVEEAYGTAKDYVSAFAERANEAVKTAETPADFVNQLFRPSMDEQAKALTTPETEDPAVLNAADPVAGLNERTARTQQYANNVAAGLLEDPATPEFVREKIAAMGGDYSSTGAQAYLGAVGMAQAAGKKIPNAVADFVAFSKEMAAKVSTIAGDIATGLTGKVSKKNLQDVDDTAIQPLVNVLAQRLGPQNAAQAPKLAKQLIAAANRLSPDAQINEAVDRRLRNFSEAIDDETLDMVTELSGSDALRNSIAKIRAIPSAMSDVRQGGGSSFLESLITNDAARQYLPRIAEAVDELALAGTATPARASALKALAAGVFGSVKNAQTVVDYYGKMRRSAYKLEAEQAKVREDRDAVDPDMLPGEAVATLEGADGLQTLGSEFGSLTEQDAKEMDATYRDPNPARPFFRSTDRAELRKARREAPAGSRVATLREHTAQTGEAPQFVAARLRTDLRKRLVDSENRDTATVQQAIKDLDSIPEEMRDESFNALYKSLKTRKTENRSDLPKLRAQMEAVEKASGVSFKDITAISKRIRRAELADEGGIESDDIAELPKLKKELAKLEAKYAKNADKVLEKFAVVMKPKDETHASDDHVAKFRGILDKLPNALTGTPNERAAKKEAIEKIKKTAIKFNRKGGKGPITLSAESMVYSSQAQGSVSERFFDSVAAMLARPDIEGMVPPAADTLIVRKTGLTWGDIVPEKIADNRTERQKAAQRDKENTKAWGKEQRLLADIDTRPKLMAAIRQLQKQYLADQLKLTIAKDEPLSLNDLIERFPAGQRKEMRTAANDAAFEAALGWAKTLSRKNAAATQRNFTDESKQRVLEKYIDEQLEDRYPVEFDSSTADRIAETEQDAGMHADDRNVGADILDAEAELEMMEDRLDAAQGIAGLERKYEAVIGQLEKGLNKLIDSVPGPEQRAARAAGARDGAGGPTRQTAPANVEEEKQLRREWQEKNPDGAKKPRQPKPGAYMPNEDTSLEDEADDIEDSTDRMTEGGPARVILPNTSPYTAKDQAKSDKANKFIGRGAPGSSTAAYAKAWGDRANTGEYAKSDTVFISVNGNRPGAITPPWAEIKKATSAGATLITDNPSDRARPFNTGERNVAEFLEAQGYVEKSPGTWTPKSNRVSKQSRMSEDGSFDEPDFGDPNFEPERKEQDWKGRTNDDGSFDEPDFSGEEFPKTRKQSFVGATADPKGAAEAGAALDAGQSAEAVWSNLGWFRGPDGKLRKEIRSPVLQKRIRDLFESNDFARGIKLGELFSGVSGFEAYAKTDLANVTVIQNEDISDGGFAGVFVPEGEGVIYLTRRGARLAVLVDRAGPKMLKDAAEWGANSMDEFIDMLTDKLDIGPMELDRLAHEQMLAAALHEMQHAIQKQEGFENGGTPELAMITKYGDIAAYLKAGKDNDWIEQSWQRSQASRAMLADIGPDADPELAAHALYLTIVGEAEAHDVEKRMKLTDAEAKGLAPALADAKREFLHSAVGMIALAKVQSGYKQTTIGDKRKPPNAAEHADLKKKILEEIRRTRGNDVKLRFNRLIKHIGASGEFSMNADKTDRLIEIAVNAADPMGVAWHESLHDFFAMLDEDKVSRSIKRDLVNAANAPQVKKRLRELLKDHPEALKQLEESPEERVAYMYQFWAAGALELGPTGTGIFVQLQRLFRDLFRLVGREERAADLLTALHEGKFADTRVVAEVLADQPRDTINNRMEKYAPALKDSLDKLVQIAPDRLRDFQNDQITELAGQFEDFVQRRFRKDGEWTNKLGGILEGTTATQRRQALENMQAMKPPSNLLENKLAKFFTEMHGYMTDAGVQTLDSTTKKWVPLRQVKDYFPRVFDRAALEKDPDGFMGLLMKHGGMTEASARNTLKALTHGTGQIELAENEHALGFSPYAQAVQDRQLKFIDPSNAAEFAKYQSKDLADITAMYVKQAVHRAEYARDFGNQGEKIVAQIVKSGITDKADLENINKTVMGLEGTLGYQMSSQTKELFAGVMTLQNLVILPLSIFSQMIDPVVLAARSGNLKDAGNAYVTAIKKLTRQKDVDGEDLAEMLGIISQDTVLDAMGVAYGTTHMSKRMRNINRVFFKYNGMQGWNNSMRIAATVAGERYLLQNKGNAAALRELGLEPSDIKEKISYLNNVPQGIVRLDVSSQKVKEAMFKFVDQAVLRPSASNRPVWMSDPKFLLLAHLKQFTFAMHNVVLKRANEQLDDGNPKPWLILALAMPAILAADMAKFALTGGPPPGWTFMDFLGHAVERSGLLGLGDFGAQAMQGVGQGKMPGEALLGPSFEHLMELLRFMMGAPGVDGGDVLDRTVPGARFV